jgi:hypothetical protein
MPKVRPTEAQERASAASPNGTTELQHRIRGLSPTEAGPNGMYAGDSDRARTPATKCDWRGLRPFKRSRRHVTGEGDATLVGDSIAPYRAFGAPRRAACRPGSAPSPSDRSRRPSHVLEGDDL